MIITLSPAKSLDFDTPYDIKQATQPEFLGQSEQLIALLRQKSPEELGELMNISPTLSLLNKERFQNWSMPFDLTNARQAALAFNGDVYEGLEAPTLKAEDWEYAQSHIRILSGLYGVLKPLDLIQPYRLEMGTKLKNEKGKDLYAFWGNQITLAINKALAENQSDVLINLASEEYFKSVKVSQLSVPVITPVFEDEKAGQFKVISFYAKRARGLMARFIVTERLHFKEEVKQFNCEGYQYSGKDSTEQKWVFRRKEADR